MNKTNREVQMLALLSGKGGSGKTVIALSISKILSEAGYKVLFVDCDMSTHGATYFFESEFETTSDNILSLQTLMIHESFNGEPLKTKSGFYFIPSTLSPTEIQNISVEKSETHFADNAFYNLEKIIYAYDFVIFDCQAGYSQLAKEAVNLAKRNLIVLEPDAVSSSALRVLYLQLGNILKTSNTWQIFNKLTEEERPVYEKIFGGTLFNNLPPVPFDWEVRGSFAIGQIPSLTSQYSAFGIGILRIMKTLFPLASEPLRQLEESTVGKWYEFVQEKIYKLDTLRHSVKYERIEKSRESRLTNIRLRLYISVFITFIAFSIFVADRLYDGIMSQFLINTFTRNVIGFSILIVAAGFLASTFYSYIQTTSGLREEELQDVEQERLYKLETELEKYRTLLTTDPSLKEYEKIINESIRRDRPEIIYDE